MDEVQTYLSDKSFALYPPNATAIPAGRCATLCRLRIRNQICDRNQSFVYYLAGGGRARILTSSEPITQSAGRIRRRPRPQRHPLWGGHDFVSGFSSQAVPVAAGAISSAERVDQFAPMRYARNRLAASTPRTRKATIATIWAIKKGGSFCCAGQRWRRHLLEGLHDQHDEVQVERHHGADDVDQTPAPRQVAAIEA